MSWRVYLRLGRVSNLPTVWSNVVAATVLAGASPRPLAAVGLCAGFSLLYEGGMFLNDAFDREVDARERPERPIPRGLVSAGHVVAVGTGLLLAGVATLPLSATAPGAAWPTAAAALALAAAIVLYDAWHKGNPLAPLLMGLCRVLVYVTAAVAVAGGVAPAVVGGALVLLSYLIGLTYVAGHEAAKEVHRPWPLVLLFAPLVWVLPGAFRTLSGATVSVLFLAWVATTVAPIVRRAGRSIPAAVGRLIAGISLLDAVLIAVRGEPLVAMIAVACFVATMAAQRWVPGT